MTNFMKLGMATALVALTGCGSTTTDGTTEELAVDCGGKCDGLDAIKSVLRDPSELDLEDLIDNGKAFASAEANEFLASGDLGGLAIEFHGADDLDPLVRDLAAAFGERELTTSVNALRLRHLQSSGDTVYAETSFTVEPDASLGWSLDVDGLIEDASSTAGVGFDGGATIEARVISAHDAELDNPLDRLKTLRDFVLPRSLEDLRALKPGESFALRGEGHLGANLGVGVPLLIAEPSTAISYSVVASGGLRTRLSGVLDVQLIRLEGSEVVVDVGIDQVRSRTAWLAIKDRWGVQGLVESTLDIAGIEVDLGRLIDRALQKQLDKRLNLIEALAEKGETSSRMTVARLRFDLDADPRLLEPALAQALRGDIRLTQALSHRGEQGILAELDLLRSGLSTVSSAGIDLFGMSFFRRRIEQEGTIVVQSPAGARTVMFESLHRASGWFFSSHGYTRVGLSGLLFDPSDPEATAPGEANLVVQIEEGDSTMERDKLVDHLDGMILALGGSDALAALEGPGNALERLVQEACRGISAFDDCPMDTLRDPAVVALVDEGAAKLGSATMQLPTEVGTFVRALGDLRLKTQSTFEFPAQFTGPGTSIVVDYRLDDRALETLTHARSGFDLSQAMSAFVQAAEVRRRDSDADIAEERRDIADDIEDDLGALATVFEDHSARYRSLLEAESAAVESIGNVGARTLEVRFTVDASNRPIYADAAARSLTEARAEVARQMFDAMIDVADDLGPHAEQVVAYGLLALVPAELVDLHFDLDMKLDDTAANWREPYRVAEFPEALDLFATGSEVSPIDGGLFDVEGLPVVSQ